MHLPFSIQFIFAKNLFFEVKESKAILEDTTQVPYF